MTKGLEILGIEFKGGVIINFDDVINNRDGGEDAQFKAVTAKGIFGAVSFR